MITSVEEWPTKAKEAPSPHEVKLALLDTMLLDAMLFCSLFHIITACYLIESIPYDLMLASSTNAKFFAVEHVE